MFNTGIVRRIDELGRVVIPKEIRRSMNVNNGDPLEIYVDKEKGAICFIPYHPEWEATPDKCAEYVRKRRTLITSVSTIGDRTTVVSSNGVVSEVTLQDGDEFDINKAICYALEKMGYTTDNPVAGN